VAFSRQVHHRIRSTFFKQPVNGTPIADVDLLEPIARIVGDCRQRVRIGRVGQLVDVDHLHIRLRQQMADHSRADEPGSAGDEQGPDHDRGNFFIGCPVSVSLVP
jgi:hypothetical protein